jgi:hypothetical protein
MIVSSKLTVIWAPGVVLLQVKHCSSYLLIIQKGGELSNCHFGKTESCFHRCIDLIRKSMEISKYFVSGEKINYWGEVGELNTNRIKQHVGFLLDTSEVIFRQQDFNFFH